MLLQGHSAEIISLSFNSTGTQLITGSFDHTVMVWDVNSGKWVLVLTRILALPSHTVCLFIAVRWNLNPCHVELSFAKWSNVIKGLTMPVIWGEGIPVHLLCFRHFFKREIIFFFYRCFGFLCTVKWSVFWQDCLHSYTFVLLIKKFQWK